MPSAPMSASSIALILPLADAQSSRRTGAKATCLSKLVAASFAVPRGFVLSADAYRAHLWASGERGNRVCHSRCRAAPRPSERRYSHTRSPTTSGRRCRKPTSACPGRLGCPTPRSRVRSSALDDGVNGGGFPGAYESYLNVSGFDELNAAIKRVVGFAVVGQGGGLSGPIQRSGRARHGRDRPADGSGGFQRDRVHRQPGNRRPAGP